MDFAHGRALARFAARLWQLEQHAPSFYPLERQSIWEGLLAKIMQDTDFEWLIIDAAHCKVHPHAAGAVGGNQAMSRTKGG